MATVNLSTRPRLYGVGDGLGAGTFRVVRLPDGQATVERRVGLKAWYPLTTRSDPGMATLVDRGGGGCRGLCRGRTSSRLAALGATVSDELDQLENWAPLRAPSPATAG